MPYLPQHGHGHGNRANSPWRIHQNLGVAVGHERSAENDLPESMSALWRYRQAIFRSDEKWPGPLGPAGRVTSTAPFRHPFLRRAQSAPASKARGNDMPRIHVSVSHQLTQADARKRIQKAITEAKKQNPEKVRELNLSWEGYVGNFSGRAMGHSVEASVAVGSGEVTVDGKLPLLASPFKGKIETAIQDMLRRLLA
jgi:hypothetical protein